VGKLKLHYSKFISQNFEDEEVQDEGTTRFSVWPEVGLGFKMAPFAVSSGGSEKYVLIWHKGWKSKWEL
jgi:hypothetical protein